jgi:hypothetical protein
LPNYYIDYEQLISSADYDKPVIINIFLLLLDHWCTPPAGFEPATLNITLTEWKNTFLPQEKGPDHQVHIK